MGFGSGVGDMVVLVFDLEASGSTGGLFKGLVGYLEDWVGGRGGWEWNPEMRRGRMGRGFGALKGSSRGKCGI